MSDLPTFQNAPTKIQHIIRMFNTNIDGTKPCITALTAIKGIGRRISDAILKRSNVDLTKRAGELTEQELESITNTITNLNTILPAFMLNRNKDFSTGADLHLVGNAIDGAFRLFLERGKKMRHVRVGRLVCGLKVRGQRTKSNGRHGGAMGVSRKK